MTLQLSAQAGVLRGEKQKKRGEQKEKKNKVHLPFCAFLSRKILLLFPSCSLFLFRLLAFLSHSFTFFFFSAFLSSVHFYLILILPLTHFFFPLHCASLFIYFGHSVLLYKKLFILQCIFFPVLYSQCYSSESTGLSEGL